MSPEQLAATKALGRALRKVHAAKLLLRIYDGTVFVAPSGTNLWPNGADGDVIAVMEEYGLSVPVVGLDADGGAGR